MTNDVHAFAESAANGIHVRGFLHRPASPSCDGFVLTHGAGSNSNAPLLVALAGTFCAAGLSVLRCDLPFRQDRPTGPPHGSAERDQQGIRAAVDSMRKQATGRVFLGGHSYGGRQASMLASAEPGLVEGLLLLSYPLHPPKRPAELRTAHFPKLRAPALFVHGTRDGFGSIEELTAARQLIPARTEVLAIEGAGHELLTKRNRDTLPETILRAFEKFLQGTTSTPANWKKT